MTSRTAPAALTPREAPPIPAGLTRGQLLEIYRYLRLTRTLEERLVALYRPTKVIGGRFLPLGPEGAVGASPSAPERGPPKEIPPPVCPDTWSRPPEGGRAHGVLAPHKSLAVEHT